MTKGDVIPAWRKILAGKKPLLSVEITKECPLRCPGCYAYEPAHLGVSPPHRQLSFFRGQALVEGLLSLVRKHQPLHLSIVGGEPLVCWREIDLILPQLEKMGVEVQLVTSAVRIIPQHWARLSNLHVVVSVDGLPSEHDRRRTPATYGRVPHTSQSPQHGNDFLVKRPGKLRSAVGLQMHENVASEHVNLSWISSRCNFK